MSLAHQMIGPNKKLMSLECLQIFLPIAILKLLDIYVQWNMAPHVLAGKSYFTISAKSEQTPGESGQNITPDTCLDHGCLLQLPCAWKKPTFFHLMDACYDSQSRPGTPCWNLSPIITQPLHPTTSRATNCSSTGCQPASQHHATYQWKTPSPNPARATGRPQGSVRSLLTDAESRIHRLLVVNTQKRCACVWHGFKQKAVAERCPHEWGVAVRHTAQPDS